MEDLDVSATVATRRDAHVKGCSSNDIMRNGDDDGGDDDDVERQMVFGYFSSPSLLRCKSACDESAVESPSTSLLGGSPTTLTTPAPATTAGASATWSASKRRKRRTSLLWEDIISVHEETATATCLYNDTNHVHRKMKRGKMQALHAKEE
ncbi:uncharacterized protein ACA1_270670 [Acanthamoeba castellanii str. Neff]|jgi:hypothetical protein|uniref:Uncharacterized protein n=1 Tax=Acanthamoeba castellanii (strain ATCC 30010 / Neff) TaxID=1257118 RepID=L8H2W1_ACACF|nr:uncharacterized protein ACA1_270670 [Acanthamoeba castellanii str. Neff]ELR19572.1 hypothetical protein ACA1_270670 [Acanthamoeba castellanii str. Neff]